MCSNGDIKRRQWSWQWIWNWVQDWCECCNAARRLVADRYPKALIEVCGVLDRQYKFTGHAGAQRLRILQRRYGEALCDHAAVDVLIAHPFLSDYTSGSIAFRIQRAGSSLPCRRIVLPIAVEWRTHVLVGRIGSDEPRRLGQSCIEFPTVRGVDHRLARDIDVVTDKGDRALLEQRQVRWIDRQLLKILVGISA